MLPTYISALIPSPTANQGKDEGTQTRSQINAVTSIVGKYILIGSY